MRHTLASSSAAALFGFALCAAASSPAQAQSSPSGWQWEAAGYGWFPAIRSTTQFPTGGSGPTMDISAQDVIDALKFAAMGNFGGKLGKWGFWTDFIYGDFGGSQHGSRDFMIGGQPMPATIDGNFSIDIKTTVLTLAGTFELTKTPDYTADLLGGARGMYLKETLNWTLNGDISGTALPGRSGSAEVKANLWDAVIGIKGLANVGADGKWFLPYYLDVGGGQSKYTWQINAGVGYRFGWGAAVLTWRYLDYQMKSGDPIQNMSMSGPLLGVAFQW